MKLLLTYPNFLRMAFFISAAIYIFSGCSNDDSADENLTEEEIQEEEPIPSISEPRFLDIRDVGNSGDATDLELSFIKPTDLTWIEEFKIFLVKSINADMFDSTQAIQESGFLSFSRSNSSEQFEFPESFLDTDGDQIQEGVSYTCFVMSVGNVDSGLGGALSDASAEITLEHKSFVRTLVAGIPAGTGGMDVDTDGNIYMANFGTALGSNGTPGSNVYLVTPEGQFSVFASGLNGASGNDFDNEGNLYQSNIAGGTVSKIAPDGTATTFATGFSAPVGIVFDGMEYFYVCNCGNNSISKVDLTGTTVSVINSSLLNCPNGIDMDSEGNLYIANFSSSDLVKITPEEEVSSFATMPGNNMGHLLLRGDDIFVVGRGNNKIFKVSNRGVVETFAGTGSRGLNNGSLEQATFSLPNDISFSPDGTKMYVNDVARLDDTSGLILNPVAIRVIEIVE